MTRVLLDTNIVLDILLKREPHVAASKELWTIAEERRIEAMLAAHAITTIHYVVRKQLGGTVADTVVSQLLKVILIAEVNQQVIEEASAMGLPDFEDAVTACAARYAGCDLIITRDPSGFRHSQVPSLAPEAALALLP